MAEIELKPLPRFMQVVLGFGSAVAIEFITSMLKLVSHSGRESIGMTLPSAGLPFDKVEARETLSAAVAGLVMSVLLVFLIVLTEKYLHPLINKVTLVLTLIVVGAFQDELLDKISKQHNIVYYIYIVSGLLFEFVLLAAFVMVKDKLVKPYHRDWV